MTIGRASLFVIVLSLAACGSRRAAPPPAASSESAGGVVIVEAGPAEPATEAIATSCSATLQVHGVSVRSGCQIDERVSGAPGTLVYPCEGGAASASFGASVFQGTVSATGEVTLDLQTGFDFTDRCHWTTKQSIRGSLVSGGLAYEYREEPDPGQRGCAAACLGTASVAVTR
jgi:hypothetical protein